MPKRPTRGKVCVFMLGQIKISIKPRFLITARGGDFEICAIQLVTTTPNRIILSLYGAPIGDVNKFLRKLDATLKYLHNTKSEFNLFK
jgi:predicted ThiF/HesA family dinucleotide-utilizing enzyme